MVMVDDQGEPHFDDRLQWIEIEGELKRLNPAEAFIIPKADPTVKLFYKTKDVWAAPSQNTGMIYVRIGAKLLRHDVPPNSNQYRAPRNFVPHSACDGGPAFCLHGLMHCCKTNVLIGSCGGLWNCP
ncbi:MAG: hypothetical protein OJJ21_03635 [Ferrovibrio sp.]|uniref:hypothetical protein n=1 Tax=Ferrovibrio sp. TaxID=1917215 RepID=UPI002625771F|nr:hypothetical protein [Ferrovibrio sp.]MCW0232670.1 hypothetical protein [Ferrovibrio sp.]